MHMQLPLLLVILLRLMPLRRYSRALQESKSTPPRFVLKATVIECSSSLLFHVFVCFSFPVNDSFMLQSMIGHCLGAAGGLEAIATVKAINTGWLHPSINQFVCLTSHFLTKIIHKFNIKDARFELGLSFRLLHSCFSL